MSLSDQRVDDLDVFDEAPDVVHIENVSKRFVIRKDNSLKERLVTFGRAGKRHREEFWALRNVSLTIKAGTTVGLIGHNGSGKSTLLKVIGGIIDPTDGRVELRGRIAALLELGAGFHPDLTGRENVFLNASILGLSRETTEERFDDILAFSGIGDFIDTQVKFYSSGMYVRLAFAVAVHTDPDILLVDEVLAVGDEAFQRKCLDKIRAFQQEGRTIILVTHNLSQVNELCDFAVLLNRGVVVFEGDSHEAVAAFRDILETRRQEETNEPADQRTLTGRVAAVQVCAVGRSPESPVHLGDDLEVVVEFQHELGLSDWICAIQIDNAMGQKVYGTATDRHKDLELGVLKGRRQIKLVLKNTAFGEGKYFVNASLMNTSGRHIHDFPQAATFNVREHPLASGSLYVEPVFIDLGVVSGPSLEAIE